ncbi:MAG: hypothetical protein ACTSRZ_19800 [Promethearchaeota archaeon]
MTKESNFIYYIFVSDATTKSPTSGIKLINNISSEYNFPVNWIVNLKTAEIYKDFFEEFHAAKGDDLIFKLQAEDPVLENPGMEKYKPDFNNWNDVEKFRSLIKFQKKEIIKLFPWAKLNTAYLDIYSNAYLEALKQENFIGLYGIEWRIDNYFNKKLRGIPLGIYRSSNFFYLPKKTIDLDTQIRDLDFICIEKMSLDFNRVFHSRKDYYGFNSLYLQKRRILTENNIRYWEKLVELYRKNSKNNNFSVISHFEPADQLEFTMKNNSYRFPYEIEEAKIILNKFLRFLAEQHDIAVSSISDVIESFHSNLEYNFGANHFIFDNFIIPNREYQLYIRTKEYRKFLYKNKIYYGIKKLLNKASSSDKPEILPKNGKNFPPLFIFQDELCQIFFYLNLNNIEEKGINNRNKIVYKPLIQYFYRNNWIVKRKYYPLIKNYIITEDFNKIIINLGIKSSEEIPWGLILDITCNRSSRLNIIHSDKNISSLCVEKSKVFDNFAFIYLKLYKGINKYQIIINKNEKA